MSDETSIGNDTTTLVECLFYSFSMKNLYNKFDFSPDI